METISTTAGVSSGGTTGSTTGSGSMTGSMTGAGSGVSMTGDSDVGSGVETSGTASEDAAEPSGESVYVMDAYASNVRRDADIASLANVVHFISSPL